MVHLMDGPFVAKKGRIPVHFQFNVGLVKDVVGVCGRCR